MLPRELKTARIIVMFYCKDGADPTPRVQVTRSENNLSGYLTPNTHYMHKNCSLFHQVIWCDNACIALTLHVFSYMVKLISNDYQ